jgi:hypothetical protein
MPSTNIRYLHIKPGVVISSGTGDKSVPLYTAFIGRTGSRLDNI